MFSFPDEVWIIFGDVVSAFSSNFVKSFLRSHFSAARQSRSLHLVRSLFSDPMGLAELDTDAIAPVGQEPPILSVA